MKIIIYLFLVCLISSSAWASKVLQVHKSNRLAKISVDEDYPVGAVTYFYNRSNKVIAIGKIRRCQKSKCIVVVNKYSKRHPIQKGFRALVKTGTSSLPEKETAKKNHILINAEASFSRSFGLGYQRSFSNDKWRLGANYELLKDKINETSISGNIISLELQRRLWFNNSLSLFGVLEAGMINTEFDFTEIFPSEEKQSMSAPFVNLGVNGTYQFHKSFAAEIGGGIGHNTLDNTIEGGEGRTYVSDFDGTYSFLKVALRFRF